MDKLHELSDDTLLRYGRKAKAEMDYNTAASRAMWPFFKDERKALLKKAQKRSDGIERAGKIYDKRGSE
jgi:hypothetical protein